MKIVAKISIKSVIGSVPTRDVSIPKMHNGAVVLDKNDQPVMETVQRGIKQELMRVFGTANKAKGVNTNFGESIEFGGNFEATNLLTGEIYRGTRMFLPSLVSDMLYEQVKQADGQDVQFAFDIGADSANTPNGYQYTITPLIAVAATDPLTLLKQSLNLPALRLASAEKAPAETGEVKTAETPAETAAETAAETGTEKPAGKKAK
jgi:hypothetical protein